jgi:hypothetical protein
VLFTVRAAFRGWFIATVAIGLVTEAALIVRAW